MKTKVYKKKKETEKEFSRFPQVIILRIDILNSSMTMPKIEDLDIKKFNFSVEVTHTKNINQDVLNAMVSIKTSDDERKTILSSFDIGIVYEIPNITEVITIDEFGKIDNKEPSMIYITELSVGIARGALFSFYKGTFLHNAYLPTFDPRNILD